MYHIISWYFPHASTQSSVYYGHVLLIFSGTNLWLTLLPNFLSLSPYAHHPSFLPSFNCQFVDNYCLSKHSTSVDKLWSVNATNWTGLFVLHLHARILSPVQYTYLLVYLLDKHHFAFHSRSLSFFLSLPPSNFVLIPVDLIFTFPRTLWFVQASRKQDLTRRRIESKSKPGKSPFITHTPSSSSSTSTSTIQWNIHEIGEQANHLLPSCKMTRQRLVTFPKLHSLQISIACYTTPPLSLWMAPQKSSFNGNRSRLPTKRVFNSVVVVSRENRMWEILCHYYYWSNERMNEWSRGWIMIFPGSFSGSPWHPFDRDGGGEK